MSMIKMKHSSMYFIHVKKKILIHCFDMDQIFFDKTKYVATSSKYSKKIDKLKNIDTTTWQSTCGLLALLV